MVLPGTILMPHALLPLFIFEQRYREMLRLSLLTDRVICIALMKKGVTEARSPEDFYHVGGLGLIRACVAKKEGSSHLVLHGIARVELAKFVQETPFYMAQVRELTTENANRDETRSLSVQVIELCLRRKMKELALAPEIEKQLPQLSNPEVLTNVVTNTFVHDPHRQQEILQESRIAQRLNLLLEFLR